MKKLIEKLKKRWEVDRLWQVVLILFIFSISGMTGLYVRKAAFQWLGFYQDPPFWEEAGTWLVVIFASYQILFLLYGFMSGQFDFAWRFEKRNIQRIKKVCKKFKSKIT